MNMFSVVVVLDLVASLWTENIETNRLLWSSDSLIQMYSLSDFFLNYHITIQLFNA